MLKDSIFVREILDFLHSLTIKNAYIASLCGAERILDELPARLQEPALLNPYYRHMVGEYILDTDTTPCIFTDAVSGVPYLQDVSNTLLYSTFDTLMYVDNFDVVSSAGSSSEKLVLTRALMKTHPRTANRYKVGTPGYKTLCDTYPTQEDLIRAIVVNNDTTIGMVVESTKSREALLAPYTALDVPENAETLDVLTIRKALLLVKNYSVLGYDGSLLYDAERESILSRVKEFLLMYDKRYDIKEFYFDGDYALVAWSAGLLSLFTEVLTQRIVNLRTERTHPDHIWEYLKDHGLEDYRDVLTEKQVMYLYRNIEYFWANKGKMSNALLLAEALLSDFKYSLSPKTIVLDTVTYPATAYPTPKILSEYIDHSPDDPLKSKLPHPLRQAGQSTMDVSQLVSILQANNDELPNQAAVTEEYTVAMRRLRRTYTPTKVIEIVTATGTALLEEVFLRFAYATMMDNMVSGRFATTAVTLQFKDQPELTALIHEWMLFIAMGVSRLSGQVLDPTTSTSKLPTSIDTTGCLDFMSGTLSSTLNCGYTQCGADGEPEVVHKLVNTLIDLDAHNTAWTALLTETDKTRVLTTNETIPFVDMDEYHTLSDMWYGFLESMVYSMYNTSYSSEKAAWDRVIAQRLKYGSRSCPNLFVHTSGTQVIDTFKLWLEERPSFKVLLNPAVTTNEDLDKIILQTVDALFGFSKTDYSSIDIRAPERFAKLKQLFTQMCSYNDVFVYDEGNLNPTFIAMPMMTMEVTGASTEDTCTILHDPQYSFEEII